MVKEIKEGLVINISVETRASRSDIVGMHGGVLKIKLKSPPVEGRANKELIEVLSERLGIPKSNIEIISGKRARNKLVRLYGVTADRIKELQWVGKD